MNLMLSSFLRARKSAERMKGDAARAQGNWLVAAQHYEAHLVAQPDDWRTWVQLGHACKERGDFDAAGAAYDRALGMAPGDADLRVQIGHLLKLQGRMAEAASAYAEALALNAQHADAQRELATLGRGRMAQRMIAAQIQHGGAISGMIYDIGDMLSYFQHAHHPSGIQRVQIEFCRRLVRAKDAPRFAMCTEDGGLFQVEAAAVERVVAFLDRRDRSFDAQKRFIQSQIASLRPIRLGPGATLIILGAFWVMRETMRSLAAVKASGVQIGAYIYDLIPIEYPEYCDIDLVHRFTDNFHQLCAVADFFLTISEHTRCQVQAHLAKLGRSLPIEAVPLAHEIPMAALDAEALPGVLSGKRFVLCVCTIEPRKNHGLLFAIWRRLEREMGADAPLLVLAGRSGWNIASFTQQMRNTNDAGGLIVTLTEVSDGTLRALYQHCVMTVFPSYAEGWGLPVGESLMFGRVCAASNSSSIPEVGGDLVAYFDPWNVTEAEHVIRGLLFDDARRVEMEARLKREFRPRTWSAVADAFAAAARRLVKDAANGAVCEPVRWPVLLQSGVVHTLGFERARGRWPQGGEHARAELSCVTEDWHRVEARGIWAEAVDARLAFTTDAPPGGEIVVYAQIAPSPTRVGQKVALIGPDGGETEIVVADGPGRLLCLRLRVDDRSVARLAMRTIDAGEPRQLTNDLRDLRVGLVAFGYVLADNAAQTIRLLERFVNCAARN